MNNPGVVSACDFVFPNLYPFFESVDISSAMADLNAEDKLLRATYAPKQVIISEAGWKSFGSAIGNAIPSAQNASYYFLDFESWAQTNNRGSFYFESHDEPWKASDDGWGIWDNTLTMKSGMSAVFNGQTMADNWSCTAPPVEAARLNSHLLLCLRSEAARFSRAKRCTFRPARPTSLSTFTSARLVG
jgi:hypothetical protein